MSENSIILEKAIRERLRRSTLWTPMQSTFAADGGLRTILLLDAVEFIVVPHQRSLVEQVESLGQPTRKQKLAPRRGRVSNFGSPTRRQQSERRFRRPGLLNRGYNPDSRPLLPSWNSRVMLGWTPTGPNRLGWRVRSTSGQRHPCDYRTGISTTPPGIHAAVSWSLTESPSIPAGN